MFIKVNIFYLYMREMYYINIIATVNINREII